MKVTIAGYGSVGSYVAGLFADLEPTLYDPPLGLGAVDDLRDTDFVIVCVPTPQLPSGACDTSIVEEVVGLADPRVAIVCHSTVAVGTTERLIAETGKPLVFVPEYAGEAHDHPLRDPANRSFLIYGGHDPSASAVQALYERAYGPGVRHFRVPPTVAEVVKYMENAFLATKVAFCNEFFDLCSAVGVDYDWVRMLWLQRVLDSARALTGARYGAIAAVDEQGGLETVLTSGASEEEHRQLVTLPGGETIFAHFIALADPLRVDDWAAYASEAGLDGELPMPVRAGLYAPIRHQGESVGVIFQGHDREGRTFSAEDEEVLVTFSAQAALVIANARRYREEQRARADLETLIDTSPVGVLVLRLGTTAVAAVSLNREARRIADSLGAPGADVAELLGTLTFRPADGREIPVAEYPVAEILRGGEPLRAEEMVVAAPDGRSVRVLVNATPIFSEEQDVEAVVVMLQDLAELDDLQRLRAEFLAMVSHELRAPLTSIKGSASTLIRAGSSLDPAELLQFHHIIDDQADNMQGLITDLLDVARIEAGALSVSPGPTEATALVDEARNLFLSGGGRDRIHIDMPPDLPRVMADRRRMVQVLGNLLTNAARHSPESTAIRVLAEQEGVYVRFSVADDGVGIAADHLPGLFRKFSRIEGEEAGERADSGLGLAIARGIVEAHGGRIWAESEGPGLGTTVTFTLPAVEEADYAALRTPARPSAHPTATGRVRVLVVDDDPQTLRYVRASLSQEGFAPIVTVDPDAVGRLIAEERPHLVLLDLVLPRTDGIELLQRVPELRDIPVIFLSAYGRDQIVARALEAGAEDYIVKPFSPTELVARINTVLRRRVASASAEPSEPYVLGGLTINYAEGRAFLGGDPLPLTDTEYRLLVELTVHAGRALTHEELLQRVWGPGHSGRPGAVRTVVKNVRRKLGEDADAPTWIFSAPRVGYRMAKAETDEAGA